MHICCFMFCLYHAMKLFSGAQQKDAGTPANTIIMAQSSGLQLTTQTVPMQAIASANSQITEQNMIGNPQSQMNVINQMVSGGQIKSVTRQISYADGTTVRVAVDPKTGKTIAQQNTAQMTQQIRLGKAPEMRAPSPASQQMTIPARSVGVGFNHPLPPRAASVTVSMSGIRPTVPVGQGIGGPTIRTMNPIQSTNINSSLRPGLNAANICLVPSTTKPGSMTLSLVPGTTLTAGAAQNSMTSTVTQGARSAITTTIAQGVGQTITMPITNIASLASGVHQNAAISSTQASGLSASQKAQTQLGSLQSIQQTTQKGILAPTSTGQVRLQLSSQPGGSIVLAPSNAAAGPQKTGAIGTNITCGASSSAGCNIITAPKTTPVSASVTMATSVNLTTVSQPLTPAAPSVTMNVTALQNQTTAKGN